MKQQTRSLLVGLAAVLMVGQMVVQHALDPKIAEIHKGEKTAVVGLSNEFILGPLLGLQQAVAGALWVRADEFFHEGDYDAILPIVRMVTWLDPHQLDVYITGAWHLSYNFTDANERSDRRYIPAAQRLLEEGYENNKTLYDIPFELGWENEDKIKDYVRAEHWFRIASECKSQDKPGEGLQPAPMFVWHQLAHSLEKQGRIDECVAVWRQCLARSEQNVKLHPKDFTATSVRDSERHNLELTLKRKFSRFVHAIDFNVDRQRTKSIDPNTGQPFPADAYLATDPKDGVVGQPRRPAIDPPWNVAFDTQKNGKTIFRFSDPKILELAGEQFNIGDGARVTIRLHDDNWHQPELKDFTFDIDQSQTIMQDQHSVRGKTWGRKIDMSRDPKMYSFSRPYYYLVFEFDPRGTSPFIQDKLGWSGEGMTDPHYIWVQKGDPSVHRPDDRWVRKVYKISRDQIMALKPITEKDVVSNEEYDRAMKANAAKAPAQQ